MENKAIYMTGINKMETRTVPMPTAAAGQAVVKLEYIGVCGSDVHYLEFGKIGDFIVDGDFILGHECAGVVTEIGEGVTNLAVGDRVCLEPGIGCGKCDFCKSGHYNLCADMRFLATPPIQGCLANFISFPADMCFKLPDNISTKEGALIEPLAIGMYAAERGEVTVGSSVVILGAGCIGLVTLLACKAYGATDITVCDVIPSRLAVAKKLGATRVVNGREEDIAKVIAELTNGRGVDKVFETAGNRITTAQTADLVRAGGVIVLVGMAPDDTIAYNFVKLISKEADIRTIFRYVNMYPKSIQAVAGGAIDISGIITHEFDFENTFEGFEEVIANPMDVVKAVIKL
jgi:L-iditol 2-dehydrogenase